jgi:hypothetical protein
MRIKSWTCTTCKTKNSALKFMCGSCGAWQSQAESSV